MHERRAPRFSGTTSGIRLRKDQDEKIAKILMFEPELDKSKILRQAFDLWDKWRENGGNQPFRPAPVPKS